MATIATNRHFGFWLRRRIEGAGKTQVRFAADCGIPFFTLRDWLSNPSPNIAPRNIVLLSLGLGMSRAKLEAILGNARDEVEKHLPAGGSQRPARI